MINSINEYFIGISKIADGVWATNSISNFSYRDNGHEFINEVEEDSFWYKHRNRCIIQLVKKYQVNCIVDVGGGSGLLSQHMASNGITSILIEPATEGVRMAKNRNVKCIIHGAFADCSFKDESISNFGFFDVIEHIPNDEEVLIKTYNGLIKGGRVFITVPAFKWLWTKNDEQVGHFRRYTLSELKRKLTEIGFTVEYKSYLFWFLPLPILIFRKLLYKNTIHKRKKFEHTSKVLFLTSFINFLLSIEFKLTSYGFKIPFGSTCVIVAQK